MTHHSVIKTILLTGASALAFAATSTEAAVVFSDGTPGSTTFTATVAGVYVIDAFGAQGGASFAGPSGGQGAGVGGQFNLTAGETIIIDVGGQGMDAPTVDRAGGGGGGSFVALGATPLIIGGGGGGGGNNSGGGAGLASQGPSAGLGGAQGFAGGGGGGGFNGNGGGIAGIYSAGGGQGFPGLAGGGGSQDGGAAGNGGFGGGGGAGGGGGGGGGGFNGGVGGKGNYYGAHNPNLGGSGGSSFNGGSNAQVLASESGNGLVTISTSGGVPEPSTWSLMLSGFGFLGYVLRRRLLRTA